MECSVLFMGPVGAGKTVAVQTLSDIDVAGTEESATDETSALKPLTTVCGGLPTTDRSAQTAGAACA